jgi:hypothetical protein
VNQRVSACLALVLLCAAVGCDRAAEPENLKELRRVRSSDLDVVLLSPNDAVRQGNDTFFVEFRSATDGRLVDVGDVRTTATMPMAGMAPMTGAVDVRATDTPGRYSVTSDLSMAGDWQISVQWDGPAGQGSAMLATSAQ